MNENIYPLMRAKDIAALFGLTPGTVAAYGQRGIWPSYKIGRARRYSLPEIRERFLVRHMERQTKQVTAELGDISDAERHQAAFRAMMDEPTSVPESNTDAKMWAMRGYRGKR